MGENYEVQVESVIRSAEQLFEIGSSIASELKSAYVIISRLGEGRYWIGNQYDKVIDSLNNHLDSLNALISKATSSVPQTLSAAAQNYAAGDGISVRGANLSYIAPIEHCIKTSHMTGEVVFKYAEIENAREAFSNHFKQVDNFISNYTSKFNEICNTDWIGSAMEQFRSEIQSFATNAASASAEINTTITTEIVNSQEALRGAESNTESIASQVNAN